MYLLMNVQSKDGVKVSAPQLVNTDKVCVCNLVERELTKQDYVIIFQKVEECDESGVEATRLIERDALAIRRTPVYSNARK